MTSVKCTLTPLGKRNCFGLVAHEPPFDVPIAGNIAQHKSKWTKLIAKLLKVLVASMQICILRLNAQCALRSATTAICVCVDYVPDTKNAAPSHVLAGVFLRFGVAAALALPPFAMARTCGERVSRVFSSLCTTSRSPSDVGACCERAFDFPAHTVAVEYKCAPSARRLGRFFTSSMAQQYDSLAFALCSPRAHM